MGMLDRYIAGNFLRALLAVLALLLALFSFVILVEELESVGQGTFTTRDALHITALSMPRLVIDLLPTIALLATVIGLGSMANNREIMVMRAVGWSPWRIGRPVLELGAAMALLILVLQHVIVPPLERQASDLRARALSDSLVNVSGREFWTRSANYIVRVGEAMWGVAPQDIEIYEINRNGNVGRITQAEYADILDDNRWLLHTVRISTINDEAVVDERHATLEWQSFLSQQQMSAFVAPAETLSLIDLHRYIERLALSGLSTLRYRLIFWQQIATPVALIGMILIGLPFVMGSVRHFTAGYRITAGAGVGIGFYLLRQMAGHVALLYGLNPIATALAPSALLLLCGLLILRRMSPASARIELPGAAHSPA